MKHKKIKTAILVITFFVLAVLTVKNTSAQVCDGKDRTPNHLDFHLWTLDSP